MKKNSDGFQMEDAGWEILMNQILYDYMQPYKEIADTPEAGCYLQASLDASLKGQVTDYCKFTGETQEEAQAEYDRVSQILRRIRDFQESGKQDLNRH